MSVLSSMRSAFSHIFIDTVKPPYLPDVVRFANKHKKDKGASAMSRPLIVSSADKVKKLTAKQQTELLMFLIAKLDELDEDDYFSTEGWRHFMELED